MTEPPELPTGQIDVQAPPDQPEAAGMGNILATVVPMMGSMGVMVFMAMSQSQNTRMLLMAGAMVVAMLSMVGFNIYRQVGGHRQKLDILRREYLAYLGETRDTVRTVARRQRAYIGWHLPSPDALVLIAHEGTRLWEREAGDEMALQVRLGSSAQDLAMELIEPELAPLAKPDVVCHSAMTRFMEAHSMVDDMPFGVMLGDFSHLEVAGPEESTRAQVRAMLMHMATFTSPSTLRVAVLCKESAKADWEWLKWLPHARSGEESDALGAARMVTSKPAELTKLLGAQFTDRGGFRPRTDATQWPHLFLILDGTELPANTRLGAIEGTEGVTVVRTMTSWGPMTSRSTLRMILHPGVDADDRGRMELLLLDQQPILATPDVMGVPQAEAIARRMAPWMEEERPEAESPMGKSDPKRSQDLMELLGLGDIRDFDPDVQWKRREGRERLNVPFGVTPEGIPVLLDIKESAQQGMGPHGLLIGATGSGKSEVLRTVVLAMSLTHSPEQLNFVLVDFKGGATFAGMSDLPHVSAMISNLESELSLVDRMQDALRGEMVRRQEVLRDAGNYANVTDYEADRIAGKHSGPPMPALFLILDEFSELLSAKPEFVDLFVAIGRLGRSMSIHLLLSSQRLEAGRLKGLDSHLSYRIGLRTFSAGESRDVLGVPDAYELPSFPGVGYLKPGTDQMIRFRASYVAAPPPPRQGGPAISSGSSDGPVRVLPFTVEPVDEEQEEESPAPSGPVVLPGDAQWADMTQMDIAVARMKGKGIPAHQVWLPPLDVPDTMDSLMPDLVEDPKLGLISPSWRARGPLRIPLGIVDLPLEQRRDVLQFDFSGANGHFAVVGGPLTGKSTTLRSVVMALSLVHTPQEVQFYIIDLGGGTFTPFDGAAHVAGLATRDRVDIVNRMMAEIEGIMDDREKFFRAHRIDSMSTYRQGRAQGKYDDGYGDVFLVIDGWAAMKTDIEGLDMRIMAMMARALSFGVHVMVATNRWMDFRQQVSDALGSRLELRLGDVTDTKFDRKVAKSVPLERPGRGQEVGTHHVLVGLPRADGDHDPASLGQGVKDTLERIAKAAPASGPKLRLLPHRIMAKELLEHPAAKEGLVLGVEESRLGPFMFHPRQDSHLYLFGDSKSGKTTFLRSIAQEVMRTNTAKQAQFFVVDFRRALLDQVPEEYLAAYTTNQDEAAEQMGGLAEYLKTRMPTDSVTSEQLRNRSWWTGAEAWVLVDDYDLVALQSRNPLQPLQPLMAQAQDIGLHVIVARRMGGASRASFEPILQSMRDLGTTGILLSGSPDEGSVIGRIKPMKAVPGRAQVVSRDAGYFLAQMAWSDPRE
mgnify:FL=1